MSQSKTATLLTLALAALPLIALTAWATRSTGRHKPRPAQITAESARPEIALASSEAAPQENPETETNTQSETDTQSDLPEEPLISGSEEWGLQIRSALSLIREHDPAAYDLLKQHVGMIYEGDDRFGPYTSIHYCPNVNRIDSTVCKLVGR